MVYVGRDIEADNRSRTKFIKANNIDSFSSCNSQEVTFVRRDVTSDFGKKVRKTIDKLVIPSVNLRIATHSRFKDNVVNLSWNFNVSDKSSDSRILVRKTSSSHQNNRLASDRIVSRDGHYIWIHLIDKDFTVSFFTLSKV